MIYKKILNDFLFFFFGLFIFSSTFSIAIAQIALGVCILLFLIIIIKFKYNPFPKRLIVFYFMIGMYIAWNIIASSLGDIPGRSLLALKQEWLFLAIPIGIYVLGWEKYRRKIIITFAFGVLLISIYAIIQHFTGIYWFKENPLFPAFDMGYRVKGFFPHRLTFGNYYAVASSFFIGYYFWGNKKFSPLEKKLFITAAILGSVATLFSYSYGPIFALITTIFLLAILKNRKIGLITILAGLTILLASIFMLPGLKSQLNTKINTESSVANEASRVYIWSNAIKMIEDNPIFGVGASNFVDTFEKINPGHRIHGHAHNDLLHIGAVSGLPGMIIWFGIWVLIFIYLKNSIISSNSLFINNYYWIAALAGSFAFFMTSITEATFSDEEVRQLLMFVWAIGLYPWALIDKNKSEPLSE
jgi:O-antigen ligase